MSWAAVTAALDRAQDAGQPIRVWLRDDDAVSVTPALARLRELCTAYELPVLLAVIPAGADDALGHWVAETPAVHPCQHGYAHTNHAAAGRRACELGGDRPAATVMADLAAGRRRLQALFGARLSDILVPPWNRIDPGLIPHLPGLGFSALSVFGPPPDEPDGIARLNADLDIIDWRNGRVGRTEDDLAGKLAALIAAHRPLSRPIGLLTHHLAHDAQAWRGLEVMVSMLSLHPAVTFGSPHARSS